jgi:hypothetical protein
MSDNEMNFEAGGREFTARQVLAPGSQRDREWNINDRVGAWYGSIKHDPFSETPSWRAFCGCDETEDELGTFRPYTVADSMLSAAQRVALSAREPDQPTASLEDPT